MKRTLTFLILLLNLTCLHAISTQTDIDKKATDLKNLKIGDRILLNIDIEHEKSDSVTLDRKFAQNLQEDPDFAIINYKKKTSKIDKKYLTEFDIKTAFFATGEQTIPALKFNIWNKKDTINVYSDSIAVPIQSVITSDSTAGNIKDIAKPLSISLTAWDILFPLFILIIVVLVIIFLIKRKSVKSIIPFKKKKQIPAHVIALKKLDQLELDKLLEQGEIKTIFCPAFLDLSRVS